MKNFPPGKLPNRILEKLLSRTAGQFRDPRVLVGPRVGEDAAVLDYGDKLLIVASDPITFSTENLAWQAVNVNANDIAVRGARPRWFLATVLLPEGKTDERLVDSIFDEMVRACATVGCTPIGGHTEITLGLTRPIIVGTMLGEVDRDRLVITGGAQVGDAVLLTQGIAIEGTAVLARELESRLLEQGLSAGLLTRAKALIHEPGIGVTRAALAASGVTKLHAMHDPTEGGIATGLEELADASGVGLRIERASVPILPECQAICATLGLDPLGTLASGALLICAAPSDEPAIIETLEGERIPCVHIGQVLPREEGLTMNTDRVPAELPRFERDEVARALAGSW